MAGASFTVSPAASTALVASMGGCTQGCTGGVYRGVYTGCVQVRSQVSVLSHVKGKHVKSGVSAVSLSNEG